MSNHTFTLILLTTNGYTTEVFYGSRTEAEKRMDTLIASAPVTLAVYLYGGEHGGFINACDGPAYRGQ